MQKSGEYHDENCFSTMYQVPRTNGPIKNNNFKNSLRSPMWQYKKFHHIILQPEKLFLWNDENDKSQNNDENKIFLFMGIYVGVFVSDVYRCVVWKFIVHAKIQFIWVFLWLNNLLSKR